MLFDRLPDDRREVVARTELPGGIREAAEPAELPVGAGDAVRAVGGDVVRADGEQPALRPAAQRVRRCALELLRGPALEQLEQLRTGHLDDPRIPGRMADRPEVAAAQRPGRDRLVDGGELDGEPDLRVHALTEHLGDELGVQWAVEL